MDNAHAIEADAVVIGAGPAGLFQVFQLGLQGIAAHLIDALPHTGGQCAELYPDKPIYDIPGVPVCTGRELVALLERQIAPFQPQRHLGQTVAELALQPDGRVLLQTSAGTRLLARAVFIAAGVGAFVPRAVKAEGIDAFTGSQLLYHPDAATLAQRIAGRHVVVHGGEDGAVLAAIACARTAGAEAAASVSLLHRRDVFQAPPEALAELAMLREAGRIRVVAGQIAGIDAAGGRLQALQLATPEGGNERLPLDLLLAYLGISPRLGPVVEWGLAIERKQLVVDTAGFRTSVPAIHAVGDINTYPASASCCSALSTKPPWPPSPPPKP